MEQPNCKNSLKKVIYVECAHSLEDLQIPPSNRLHALKGNLKGYHSCSINLQWRIIFLWNDGQVKGVKITDYH